jgi:hypothetical protein
MSVIDTPLDAVPFEQLPEHIRQKEYLRNASDPNETAINGQTCVSIALTFCNNDEGIGIL